MVDRITSCPEPGRWLTRIEAAYLVDAAGCWIWQRPLDRYGYGRFKATIGGRSRQTGAHRAAFLAICGDILGGLDIDHLCRVRACVNPAHMELVTTAENTQRGDHAGKGGQPGRSGLRKGAVLHSCAKHGRDEGVLRTAADGYTRWHCRICNRINRAAYKARSRDQQGSYFEDSGDPLARHA